MKSIISIVFICFTLISFGQERVNEVGLNKRVPTSASYGMKASANYYFPSYAVITLEALSSTVNNTDYPGGGLGFFYRKDLKKHFSLQPELNIVYRSGSSSSSRYYEYDTMISVTKEDVVNYMALSVEIPIYLKWRWELTALRKGHYKANSAIGVFIGPRVVLTPYSKVGQSERTITTLYQQSSTNVISRGILEGTRYSPIASVGLAAGLDYEWRNGFMIHASFYRGFLSHSLKAVGYKAYDNRAEIGIGVRFN